MTDADVGLHFGEANARKQFDALQGDEACDLEDGSDELRISINKAKEVLSQAGVDAIRAKMDAEFASFLNGEKYDYVKDMRKAYSEDLATPLSAKIFKTIPAHVFWDIKKPLVAE